MLRLASLFGGANIMESIEHYQRRAEECARLAKSASDEQSRAALLLQMKIYLSVIVRLRNYAAGKGFPIEAKPPTAMPQ